MNAKINWSFHRIDEAICFTEGNKREEIISFAELPAGEPIEDTNKESGHCRIQGRKNGHCFHGL